MKFIVTTTSQFSLNPLRLRVPVNVNILCRINDGFPRGKEIAPKSAMLVAQNKSTESRHYSPSFPRNYNRSELGVW